MSADITTIGLAVDSTQVETATKKLDSFAESGKEAEKAAQGLGKATQGSAAGVKTAAQAADLAARQQAFLARSTDAVGSSTKKADGELRALIKSVENARNAYAKVKGSADGFAASLKEIAASSGKAVGELSKADYDEIAGGFSAVAASLGKIGQASGQATTAVKLMAERYIAQATGMAGTNVRMAASFAGALGKLAQLSPTLAVAAGSAAAAAAGVALFGVAMFKAEQESSAFASALIMSGNAAGSTVDQLNSMAAAVDGVVGTQAQAASAIAKLAASGKFAAGEIQLLAEAAVGLEQIGGQAVEKTVEQFVELEKDPVNALLKLNEQTRFMTAELFNNVKALQDQGRESEAAAAAQQAYASALKSRTAEMQASLGTLERAWLGVKTAAAEAWDAVLAVGRPTTQSDVLQQQKNKLASYQAEMAEVAASDTEWARKRFAALSALATALETTISIAESDVRTTKQATAAQATATEQAQKYGLAVQARSQYMEESAPKAERMAKAIEKARREMDEANKVASAAGNEPVWTKKEMADRLKEIGDSFADTGKKAKTSAQEAADAYEKLAKTLEQDIVRATNESMEGYKDLNAAQKKFLDIATSPQWAEMNDEQRRGIAINIEKLSAVLEAQRAEKELLAVEKELAEQQEKSVASDAAKIEAETKKTAALQEQLDKLVLGTAEWERRRDEVDLNTASDLDWIAANLSGGGAVFVAQARALREQVELRRKLRSATADKAADEANKRAAEKATEDWQRAADQIGQSLADNLMEGGKDAAEYIEDLFRTMVLKPVLQAAVQPVANSALNMLGMGSGGGATSAGGGGLGNLSTLGGLAGSMGSMGSIFAAGTASTFTGGMASAGAMASAGMYGSSAMMALGTVAPYLAAAYAIYSIAKSMDDSGTPHMGSVVSGSGPDLSTMWGDGSTILNNYSGGTDAALRGLVGSSTGILNALGGGGYSATAKFAADNTDASIGQYMLSKGGQQVGYVGNGTDYAKYASDAGAGLESFTADVTRVTREQLDALDLPGWARDQLDNLASDADLTQLAGVASAIEATITALDGLKESFGPLGGIFENIAGLSSDALFSLAESAGGLDALGSSLGAFFKEFYDEGERVTMQTAAMTAALGEVGLALPESRDAFRAVVEGLDLSTDAGREQFGVLMQLSGAFAELNPIIEEVKESADDSAIALAEMTRNFKSAMSEMASDTASLEVELLRAGGKETEARALERAQFLAAQGVTEEQRAAIAVVYDYNQSLRDQIDAIYDAAEAADLLEANATDMAQALAGLSSATDSAMMKLLSAEDAVNYQFTRISEKLAGLGLDIGVEALLAATKSEILEFAQSFSELDDVSIEAKTAVWDLAGSLGGLKDSLDSAGNAASTAAKKMDLPRFGGATGYPDVGSILKNEAMMLMPYQVDDRLKMGDSIMAGTYQMPDAGIGWDKMINSVRGNVAANGGAINYLNDGMFQLQQAILGREIENEQRRAARNAVNAAEFAERESRRSRGQDGASAWRQEQDKLLQEQIDSTQDLIDALDKMRSGMLDLKNELIGGALDPSNPALKYASEKEFVTGLGRQALTGDMAAAEMFKEEVGGFLQLSQGYNASSTAYAQDFSTMIELLDQIAASMDRQQSTAYATLRVQQEGLSQVADNTDRTAQATTSQARSARVLEQRAIE